VLLLPQLGEISLDLEHRHVPVAGIKQKKTMLDKGSQRRSKSFNPKT
jgi:hypothetical protein